MPRSFGESQKIQVFFIFLLDAAIFAASKIEFLLYLGWFSLSDSVSSSDCVSSFDSVIDSLSLSDKISMKLELTKQVVY